MYHKIGREYDFSIARVCDPRKDFIVGEILPFQKIRTANGRLDGRQRGYKIYQFVPSSTRSRANQISKSVPTIYLKLDGHNYISKCSYR
jgi:hypothetical protein